MGKKDKLFGVIRRIGAGITNNSFVPCYIDMFTSSIVAETISKRLDLEI